MEASDPGEIGTLAVLIFNYLYLHNLSSYLIREIKAYSRYYGEDI